MKKQKQILTPERLPVVLFALLFVAVLVTFQTLQPAFLSLNNIINIAKSVSTTVIAAVGLTEAEAKEKNIPVKTAKALIQKFGSLDGVYANLEDKSIRPKLRENDQ